MNQIINLKNKIHQRKNLRINQTPQEKLLWIKLRNNLLGYKIRRQAGIGNYIADFYCHEKLVVIELDGSQHQDNANYDKNRDKYFNSLGIVVLRFWNDEVNRNIEGVLKIIKETLDKTQPHPSPLLQGEGKIHLSTKY